MFSTVLIANRGEIACRIMRTARRMGISTIAVYSDADAGGPHVALADQAYSIGPADAASSYLNGTRILKVAATAGAEAIHPGYGFLSENGDFAEACEKAGIIFIGPDAASIRSMGLKDEAKAIAKRAGVPVIPGYAGPVQDARGLLSEAEAIGYPVIIKAVAGGGGRGMRVVHEPAAFAQALEACRREAKAAFGDDRVLLERYFASSRHVEVQLIGDAHGSVLHLFERDCSVQRRHQKIIEEAPAYGIGEETRAKMHAAAVAIARQVGYRNAGTVEFLYEEASSKFYFMEMNTRLQVEHPVTEMITGLDLVELQLRVAAGEKLPLTQAQVSVSGHAIEARLYAEDPAQGFLPQIGIVQDLIWAQRNHIRVDSGVVPGSRISSHYDAMIAKVIGWGESRSAAIETLREALNKSFLFGVKTNKGFLLSVLDSEGFMPSAPNTGFLESLDPAAMKPGQGLVALACAGWLYPETDDGSDPWKTRRGWVIGGTRVERRSLLLQGQLLSVQIGYGDRDISIEMNGKWHLVQSLSIENGAMRALVDGEQREARFLRAGRDLFADVDGHQLMLSEPAYALQGSEPGGSGSIRAPMPGRILKLEAAAGTMVEAGARLLVMEAMKMEHVLRAPFAGRMADMLVREGDQVREGDILCTISSDSEASPLQG
jgi:3-methylcrotonyl-CoA carboxylase alpha subunit